LLVDLALTDQVYVSAYNNPFIQVGGEFAGVTVRSRSVRLRDNIKIRVNFETSFVPEAAAAFEEWKDQITSRIQGVLDLARYQGQNLGVGPEEYRSI